MVLADGNVDYAKKALRTAMDAVKEMERSRRYNFSNVEGELNERQNSVELESSRQLQF